MHKHITAIAVIVIAAGAIANGQGAARGTAPAGQGGRGVQPAWAPLESRIVKGMPYSAEVVRETIQTLADGNRIINRTTGRVYRDSQGRMRREDDGPNGVTSVSISDPVAGKSLVLNPTAKTYRETPGMVLEAIASAIARDQYSYVIQTSGGGVTTFGRITALPENANLRPRRGDAGQDRVELGNGAIGGHGESSESRSRDPIGNTRHPVPIAEYVHLEEVPTRSRGSDLLPCRVDDLCGAEGSDTEAGRAFGRSLRVPWVIEGKGSHRRHYDRDGKGHAEQSRRRVNGQSVSQQSGRQRQLIQGQPIATQSHLLSGAGDRPRVEGRVNSRPCPGDDLIDGFDRPRILVSAQYPPARRLFGDRHRCNVECIT
jgi:hypothetical protein